MADYSGLGQALASAGVTYVRGLQEREAMQRKRAEDKLAAQTAEAKIQAGVPEQQAQLALQQSEDSLAKLTAEDTYRAFRGYNATGQVDHINNVLSTNKYLQQAFNAMRVDRVDPMQDSRLIIASGMNPNDFAGDEGEMFRKRYLKATAPDGSVVIADILAEQAATGYHKRVYGEDLELMKQYSDLYGKSKKPTAFQSDVEYMSGMRTQQDPTDPKASEGAVAEELWKSRVAGSTPGKLAEGEQAVDAFYASGLGDIPYKDYTPQQAIEARRHLTNYEQLTNSKPPQAMIEDLRFIKTLSMFGGEVVDKLTPAATGALDKLVGTVERYTSLVPNAVKRQAQSAYTAYRNVMLRLTSGAAVTDGEASRFMDEFGSLNQRYSAVIPAFKTQMLKLKSMLDGIVNTMHPMQAHIYTGMTMDQIDQSIVGLDTTIAMLERLERNANASGKPITEEQIEQELANPGGSSSSPNKSSSLAERIRAKRAAETAGGAQ